MASVKKTNVVSFVAADFVSGMGIVILGIALNIIVGIGANGNPPIIEEADPNPETVDSA